MLQTIICCAFKWISSWIFFSSLFCVATRYTISVNAESKNPVCSSFVGHDDQLMRLAHRPLPYVCVYRNSHGLLRICGKMATTMNIEKRMVRGHKEKLKEHNKLKRCKTWSANTENPFEWLDLRPVCGDCCSLLLVFISLTHTHTNTHARTDWTIYLWGLNVPAQRANTFSSQLFAHTYGNHIYIATRYSKLK